MKLIRILKFTLVFFTLFIVNESDAQYTWTNPNSSTWSTTSNWSSSLVPTSTVVAQFSVNPTSGTTVTLSAASPAAALSILAGRTASLTLAGLATTTLTLSGASITLAGASTTTANVAIVNYAAGASALTIGVPLSLGSGKIIVAGGGSTSLTPGNTISLTSTFAGAGMTFLGGGTWDGTSGTAGGILKLAGVNSPFTTQLVVGSTGTITNCGILQLDIINALSATTATVLINNGSQLYLNPPSVTPMNQTAMTLNGTGNAATGYGRGALRTTSLNAVQWGTSGTQAITLASASVIYAGNTFTLGGGITGNGLLIKEGPGNLVMNGASNTMSGGIKLSEGQISITKPSSLLNVNDVTLAQSGASVSLTLSNSCSQTIGNLSSTFTSVSGPLTQTLSLGTNCTLTINQSSNTTFGVGSAATLTSVITGGATSYVVKTGSGRLTLTNGGHTFYGGLTINQGELRLAPASSITLGSGTNICPVLLGGGILGTTGIGAAAICSLGVMTLATGTTSTLSLDNTSIHTVRFTSLAAATGNLVITGWQGAFDGTAGTKGRVFIGTTAALSAAQLAQITFNDGGNIIPATQLSTGEIVPWAQINITAASYGPFVTTASNVISVGYSTPATYFTGNFKVQLSDATGTFSNYTSNIIGTGTNASSGSISATISSGTAVGYYRVRVINTAPYTTASPDNGSSIVVNNSFPIINSLSAYSGVVQGSSITINGANFNSTLGNNIVYFGAVKAHPVSGSTTSLTVTVPFGATLGPISVYDTSNKYVGSSSNQLIPSYNNVYFETGSISFQPKVDYVTGTCPNIAVTADLDGDGLPELISVNKISRSLTILQNQGAGVTNFTIPALSLPCQGNPSNIKIADIDGDGRPDIVIATGSGGSSIGIYRNTTNFASPTTPRTLSFATRADIVINTISQSPGVLGIADFDGDGRLDIAAACYATNPAKLLILRNTNTAGGGTVNSFALSGFDAGVNPTAYALTSSLCIGDFNGDHYPDIAMINQNALSPGTLSVFKNTSGGPGNIAFGTPLALATGIYPLDVQSGDVDNDGAVDIVVTQSQSNSVSLFRNTWVSPSTSLSFSSQIVISSSLSNPAGVSVGDLDGDGKPEIVASNFIYAGSVNIFKNNSTSGSPSFVDLGTFATGKYPAGINIGDLDGDGYPEIITGNTGNDTGNTVSILRNTPLPVIGTITPSASVICAGASTTLTYSLSLPAGETGKWVSSDTTIAKVNASTGVVTGISGGTATISYTVTVTRGYISRSVTAAVTVNALPAVSATGFNTTCQGITTTLSGSPAGGTWSHVNAVTAVNSYGGVTGVAASGTDTVKYLYTSPVTGCSNCDTQSITIVPFPNPGTITGTDSVCPSAAVSLSTTGDPGGKWYSTNTYYATVDSVTGVVTGVDYGNTFINYRIVSGCGTFNSYLSMQVLPLPDAGAISVPSYVCTGASMSLSESAPGGSWTSGNPSLATISSSGVVYGVAVGTPQVSYTVANACGASYAVSMVSVNTVPAAPAAISGVSDVCVGYVLTLNSATTGGNWNSGSPSLATVDAASGTVYAVSAGNPQISYTVSNSCGASAPATAILNVLTPPNATVTTGIMPCIGNSTTVTFTGTSGASITYNMDGGSNIGATLTGGTYALATGVMNTSHFYQLHTVGNSGCTIVKDSSVTINPQNMVWMGGTPGSETSWSAAANWSCGTVPTLTDSVIIPAGAYVPVVAANGVAKSLILAPSSALVLNSAGVLHVARTVINDGIVSGHGSIVLDGSSPQTIKGAGAISNLKVNNSGVTTIDTGSHLLITTSLTMQSGTLITNDSLELASTDTVGSAYVAPVTSGAVITGKVKVDQYIQGGYRRFRFWSHPFADTISMGQIEKYIDITGIGGSSNGFTTTASNAPSAFRFDPYTSNSTMGYDPGWKPFTKINNAAADTNKLHPGQGIRLFFRGAKGEGLGYAFMYTPSAVTVKMTGHVNQGPISVKLRKGYTDPENQEYNMVGNPYPSPVDIGTIVYNARVTGSINGSALYVWCPSIGAGGQYLAVPIGTTGPVPYYIQANTCFQVRAAHDGDSLTFSETDKHPSADNYLFKAPDEYLSLNIYDAGYHLWDLLKIRFDDKATDENDNKWDATKPSGSDFAFYSLSSDAKKLAIDARPYTDDKVIPLGISSAYAQDFILRADNIALPNGKTIYLHDKLLDSYTELKAGAEYKFTISASKNTQGNERFELSFKPAMVGNGRLALTLSPNPATTSVGVSYAAVKNVKLRILDISGVCVYNTGSQQATGTLDVDLQKLAPGMYLVELSSGEDKLVKRLIKE